MAHTGAGFLQGGEDRRDVRMLSQNPRDLGRLERLAPGNLVADDFNAEALGDEPPALGELARFQDEGLFLLGARY